MSSEVLDLAKTAPPSATPILDSAVFPPLVRRKRFLGVAAGLVVGLGIGIWMGSDYTEVDQVWQVIIGITAVLSAVVMVHELGHLLAGWFVGFHFSSFAVGPFSLALQYGKLKLRLRRMAPLGLVAMHAEGVRRLRRRSLIFIAGGPAVNFVSLPATALLVNHVFPAWGRSWMAIPAGHFAALSLLLGFVSITPFGSGSDGQRISILLSSFPSARRLMCIYALGGQSRNGIAPKFWKTTWIRAASRLRDGSRDEFSGNLLAYMAASDCKDADAAASYLERCLELVRGTRPVASDIVMVEAAIFTAWFRQNSAAADKWFAQVKKPKAISRRNRLRVEIALRCARQEFDSALVWWQAGLTWIDKLPSNPSNAMIRASWLEWQTEIFERQAQAAS